MKKLLADFARDQHGATIIEYAMLVAVLSLVIVGATRLVGEGITNSFGTAGNTMKNAFTN